MTISYRSNDDARHGGLDITISLTATEAAALDDDATELVNSFGATLRGLAMLRSSAARGADSATLDRLSGLIGELDRCLLPRLQGLRDAGVRRHHEMGGTLPRLAEAMDTPKSTAQSRRNKVVAADPGRWERWAVSPADAYADAPGQRDPAFPPAEAHHDDIA